MALELNLQNTELTSDEVAKLAEIRKNCARRILLSTSLASSRSKTPSMSHLIPTPGSPSAG